MPDKTSQRVLIIDDEFSSVQPLKRLLEMEGHAVDYAPDGVAAVALAKDHAPDLVLLDLVLQREDGFDVFRKIRALSDCEEVPILFVSGQAKEDRKVAGLQLGAGDFIAKPYVLDEVSARIALQLRLHENEQLLRKSNEDLRKAYEELRAAQQQAVQAEKLATIGRLSAGLAHEMSTPLGFVVSNLKVLVDYMGNVRQVLDSSQDFVMHCAAHSTEPDITQRAQGVLDLYEQLDMDEMRRELNDMASDCLEGAEAIARLANDLREFSRDEYEERIPSDVNALLQKALNLARSEMHEGIEVKRDLKEVPSFTCVPARITQLFLNALLNAVQAIEGNGRIQVATRAEKGAIIVEIKDNGKGIDPEVLPRIFEPFFTTKTAEDGTGLGLSIAQKIAAFHGGDMSVESAPGEGTQVRIVFRLDGAESGRAPEEVEKEKGGR